ncbi:hypothetical protein D3C71_1711650 [compost metagenome]
MHIERSWCREVSRQVLGENFKPVGTRHQTYGAVLSEWRPVEVFMIVVDDVIADADVVRGCGPGQRDRVRG